MTTLHRLICYIWYYNESIFIITDTYFSLDKNYRLSSTVIGASRSPYWYLARYRIHAQNGATTFIRYRLHILLHFIFFFDIAFILCTAQAFSSHIIAIYFSIPTSVILSISFDIDIFHAVLLLHFSFDILHFFDALRLYAIPYWLMMVITIIPFISRSHFSIYCTIDFLISRYHACQNKDFKLLFAFQHRAFLPPFIIRVSFVSQTSRPQAEMPKWEYHTSTIPPFRKFPYFTHSGNIILIPQYWLLTLRASRAADYFHYTILTA